MIFTGQFVLGWSCASGGAFLGTFGRIWGAVMSFFPSQLCLRDTQGEGVVEVLRPARYLQSAAEGCTEYLALCCCQMAETNPRQPQDPPNTTVSPL